MTLTIFLEKEFDLLKNRIVLAAGGSGGHVFPAQALAEVLLERGWDVCLITDERGLPFTVGFPESVEKLVLNVKNPRIGGIFGFISSLCLMLVGVIKVVRLYRRTQTFAMLGFGGYPSAPSMLAAQLLRLPNGIHEQNSVLGRVNQFFSKRARFLAFGLSPKVLKIPDKKVLVTGNPIRKSILKSYRKKYSIYDSGSFQILILGGSQGASFVSTVVCEAISKLPKSIRVKLRVVHQCRKEDVLRIKELYRRSSVDSLTQDFFENIFDYMNQANLVISRAGASTLSELCLIGRPSILIPLPTAVGDHQAQNASVMEIAGASLVLNQKNLDAINLAEKINSLIDDRRTLNKMSASALKLAKPNAAEAIANEIEKFKSE